MKILKALKRTTAFVLTAVMLLSCVDSLSMTSYAGEYDGRDISANETMVDITSEPSVSQNNDETEPVIIDDTNTEDTSSEGDVSDNISGDISSDAVDIGIIDEPAFFDDFVNDEADVTGNNDLALKSALRGSSAKPANIVVQAQLLHENGYCYYEDIALCDSLAEAKEATKDYYNSMKESDADYYSVVSSGNQIMWRIYYDIVINGDNPFLDEEGIAPFIEVTLVPYVDGSTRVYPDLYIAAGATVETCVNFVSGGLSISERDGLNFWGEEDQSDGSRVILGSGSTLQLYISDLSPYTLIDDIWAIEDPNGNATLIVGKEGTKNCLLNCLHIGSPEKKLGKLILEASSSGQGRVNTGMSKSTSHGIMYFDSGDVEDTLGDVVTTYVKHAEIKKASVERDGITYSYMGGIGIYGSATIDVIDLSGQIESKTGSTLKVKTLNTSDSGTITLKGDIIVSEKVDLLGKDYEGTRGWNSTSLYISLEEGTLGNIYFPKNVESHNYHWTDANGENRYDFTTRIAICIYKPTYDESGNQIGNTISEFMPGQPIFYAEDIDSISKVAHTSAKSGEKKYVFKNSKTLDGKTYYAAELECKSFWYAYADENGKFPEYTAKHTGLTKWSEEYADLDGLMAALATAEFDGDKDVKVYIPVNDSSAVSTSGEYISLGANNSPITDIEFVGDNYLTKEGREEAVSRLNLTNSSLQNDGINKVKLFANVTFRNIQVYCNSGKEIELDLGSHDATFINSSVYGYRNATSNSLSMNGGLPKVTATTGSLKVVNTERSYESPWLWFEAVTVDVPHIVLDGVYLKAPYQIQSITLKEGVNVDLSNGARVYPEHNFEDPDFTGYKFGTVTVGKGDWTGNDTYDPINPYSTHGDGESSDNTGYSIEKLIIAEGAKANAYYDGWEYTCTGINELVIGKNASFTTGWNDKLALNNLTIGEGGLLRTGLVKVTGETVLSDKSNLVMQSYHWDADESFRYPEFNTITLVKGSGKSGRQMAYISRPDWADPVRLINGIESESTASNIGLALRYANWDGSFAGKLDANSNPLMLLYDSEDATPNADMAYICEDIGKGKTQSLSVYKSNKRISLYGAVYVVKSKNFEVRGFFYAYADENGEFPEYTEKHKGLTKWSEEYAELEDVMGGVRAAQFEGDRNVKVYIPVADSSSIETSGAEFILGDYDNHITEIEFIGNDYSKDGGRVAVSEVVFVNDALSDDEAFTVKLRSNVTFRNIGISIADGNKLDIDMGTFDATFINAYAHGYRTKKEDYFSYTEGIHKITATTGKLTVVNTEAAGYAWRWFYAEIIDVSDLALDDAYLLALDDINTITLREGINVDFYKGATLFLTDNSEVQGFGGHKFGTITLKGVEGWGAEMFPISYFSSTGEEQDIKYTVDKLIVEDGAKCNVDFDNGAACSAINDIVIGKNAILSTGWNDGVVVSNLTVKEGGILRTGFVKVTGDTILTDKSMIILMCSDLESCKLSNAEFNTIMLVKSETSQASFQKAYIASPFWERPVNIINGINSESSADEIGLKLRKSDSDGNFMDWLGHTNVPLTLSYTSENASADADMAFISGDTGSDEAQSLKAVKNEEATGGYGAVYTVKPVSVMLYSAQKGETFEDARLINYFNSYDAAVKYVNTSGNANLQYYVEIKEDLSLNRALDLPKVGAGFGIVYSGDSHANIFATGGFKLPMNLTLKKVYLISTTASAKLDLNGKDLTLIDSAVCINASTAIPITGTAGNLTITQTSGQGLVQGPMTGSTSLKSLTLNNTEYRFSGKLNVSGDVKLKNSKLSAVTGDSKISGNLFMENSCFEIAGGTLTVSKNYYGLKSRIVPMYSQEEEFVGDDVYLVAKCAAKTGNFTVTGNAYIDHTDILVTGNVKIGTVYSGRDNKVVYGVKKDNNFTVTTVINTEYDVSESGSYTGSEAFGWTVGFNAGFEGKSEYKAVGGNCSDEEPISSDDLYSVITIQNAINVRRVFIEQEYFTDGYESYDDNTLDVSNELAVLYTNNAKSLAIVTTKDTPAKFIIGKKYVADIPATVSVYSLKTTGKELVIDDTVTCPVVLTNSAEQLIGRFNTLNDAFKRIKDLKNKSVVYVITVVDDTDLEKQISSVKEDLSSPSTSEAKQIIIKGTENSVIRLKSKLTLNTNVTFDGVSFDTGSAPAITLNGNTLELKNCESLTANTVKGSKNSVFKVTNDSFDSERVFKVSGEMSGIDELNLNNITFTAAGKATVGKLVLFEDGGEGNDKVRLDVALTPVSGKVKVTKAEDAFTGTFEFTPKFTVSGAIVNEGGAGDVFTVLPFVNDVNVSKYVADLYKTANDGTEVESLDAWDNHVATKGIPVIIAPKAEVTYNELKLDKSADLSVKGTDPVDSGVLIKTFSGNTSYLCYSTATHVPYALEAGDTRIAEFISWAELVKSVNAMANKRDYTVILTADGGVVSQTPETLSMPDAKAVNSLYIKAASGTPDWYYLGDSITLKCATTLENVNLVGMYLKDKKTGEYAAIDVSNCNALTISAPVDFTISGEVTLGGRHTILDGGSSKKGNFVLAEGAKLATTVANSDYGIYLKGAVKNMASVTLNGDAVDLEMYKAKKTDSALKAPEFIVTNVDLAKPGEYIMLYADEGKSAAVNITNLTYSGIFTMNGGISVSNGKIDVKNFTSGAGDLIASASDNKSSITIGNMTITGEPSGVGTKYTLIEADSITVTGKTVVNNDKLFIDGYKEGALNFKGAVEVAENCYIKLDPFKDGRSIVGTHIGSEEPAGPFTFAKASKATANVFKAAYVDGNDSVQTSVYDGSDDKDLFFLTKKGENIQGYNGHSVLAAVYEDVDDSDMDDVKGEGLYGYFVSYDDAISFMNDKTKDYFLEISEDTSSLATPRALKAPAATKAASLTVFSKDGDTFYYNAAPSFDNNVTLMNIALVSVKDGKATPAAFTSKGSYGLTLYNVSAGGAITDLTAGNLTLIETELSGQKLTVNKTLTATDSTADFTGAIVLNDVKVDYPDDLTVIFTRKIVKKNGKDVDDGSNLNIKGTVDGDIRLAMVATSSNINDYILTADEAKNIKNAKGKIGFSGKNLESCNVTFVPLNENKMPISVPAGVIPVKANDAFYVVKSSEMGTNLVALHINNGSASYYLDFGQAVARINTINKPANDYVINLGAVKDTVVTDSTAHSKLTLPGDNKANKLTITGTSLQYSSADAVIAYGTVELNGVDLVPVVSSTGATPEKANAKITLKTNSKTKVSNLILSNGAEIKKSLNTLTGVSNVSVLTIDDGKDCLVRAEKITDFKEISIGGALLETVSMSGIGKITFNRNADLYAYGTSSVGNIEIGENGAPELLTAYNVTNNVAASKFTVTGTVINNATNPIKVILITPAQTSIPQDNEKYEELEELRAEGNEATTGIPMVLAKKADASQFIPKSMSDYYIEDNDIICYKNLTGEVIADSMDDMVVEIEAESNTFKTYAKSWSDAVKIVDNAAAKEDYTFKLLADKVNAGASGKLEAMVTPQAANAASLLVTSEGKKELSYTGALNPKCNVTFDNVRIQEYSKKNNAYTEKAAYESAINVSGNVKLGFTSNTVNGGDGTLSFNTISVSKGTLWLKNNTEIKTVGAVNVGNLLIDSKAKIVPKEDTSKGYAKQTYGTVNSTVSGNAELYLTNGFSKAEPSKAVSQLSITGKVSPNVKVEMNIKKANYVPTYDDKGKFKKYELSGNAYVAMDAEYISNNLKYKDASKAPATKITVLNAPYLDGSRLEVADLDEAFAFYKISGSFYAVEKTDGEPAFAPVVRLETDIDLAENDGWELSEDFLTWEAAVTELNKVVNNDYGYKMTLLGDIGTANHGYVDVKANKELIAWGAIKSVDRSKLPMPAKVNSLTIDGDGHDFLFTDTTVSIDSDIVFENTKLVSLTKVKEKISSYDSSGKPYKADLPTYNTAGTLKLSIAKNRTVTFKNYRGNDTSIWAVGSDGSLNRYYPGYAFIGSVTGSAGSRFILDGGSTLHLNGKISGLEEMVVKNNASVTTTYIGATVKAQAIGLTVNKLVVSESNLGLYGGTASVKTAEISDAGFVFDTLTANEITLSGDDTVVSAVTGKKGSVNLKKVNVNSNGNHSIFGRITSKGASQITVNAVNFAEGCEDNRIVIGLLDATGDLFAVLYDGQLIINCPGTVPADAFTLSVGENDSSEGHMCGERDTDWVLERGTGNKNLVFKTMAH